MTSAIHAGEVGAVRDASRRLVRELGFLRGTLAGTALPPSAVHALVEIGRRGSMTAVDLCEVLALEKSSVSRMLGKLAAAGEIVAEAHGTDGRIKPLSLTAKGRGTLEGIDRFARTQVEDALALLPAAERSAIADALASYAGALAAGRTGREPEPARPAIRYDEGYRPGVIGRAVEMHARYYSRTAGFGRVFERRVAADMAAFAERMDCPANGFWSASVEGAVVGTVAIDGEDLGSGLAHLRWFIVDDGLRGAGVGRALLERAMEFCDRQGFAETHLWTFRGLDAARHLYEANGFTLAEEWPGSQWGAEVTEQRFVRPRRG
ncbi:bifunctional helix-turn-helix transcriptional regulator/GNAT family N-acetyltransferase [Azospirillum canadense]|uniref:bifunctional helix-turn-helix transcriptional regulator/GNAT family N-acetyltransferase n=1 Tax=Azospirillum canadense TaxID=403962 RepID=UPI002225F629|nr:helix-turn-helix domain-containing GNAT family N-acetyltransferase [Azospirillum canadense]MCW2237630.1 DNA-binding MarR family transcriptional regulator/N-acetylglutamate synthase-like GNAT family acetyltransferase [Azospirillum canadense]